ncbi:MAG TPA: hypothetical protein VG389_04835 [Myxococcota bacterium]|jgi:hypothetical protein|nr:hypothetical protein [Myxococcota bacterium]
MAVLRPCACCARHVRASDATCPFCGAKMARAPRLRAGPWAAAVITAGLSTLGYACNCYGGVPRDSAVPESGVVATDAGADAGTTPEAGATDASTAATDAGMAGADAGDGG